MKTGIKFTVLFIWLFLLVGVGYGLVFFNLNTILDGNKVGLHLICQSNRLLITIGEWTETVWLALPVKLNGERIGSQVKAEPNREPGSGLKHKD